MDEERAEIELSYTITHCADELRAIARRLRFVPFCEVERQFKDLIECLQEAHQVGKRIQRGQIDDAIERLRRIEVPDIL